LRLVVHGAQRGRCLRLGASFRENLKQPVFEPVTHSRTQAAGKGSMGLGGVCHRTLVRENSLDFRVARMAHVVGLCLKRLHRCVRLSIVGNMSDTTKTQLDLELVRLAKRIEELVATVEHLKEENRALRQRHESLAGERATLLQKNEQVRTRVEAMIGRLKTLEHGS
jgi:cell division protein ZapB